MSWNSLVNESKDRIYICCFESSIEKIYKSLIYDFFVWFREKTQY